MAVRDIDEGLRLEPKSAALYDTRGTIHKDLGDLQSALKDFSEAIHYDPTVAISFNNRGLTYNDLNEPEKALVDLDKATELDPNLAVAHQNKSLVLLEKKDFAGAVRSSSEAIRLNPDLPELYFIRGTANIQIGKPELAVADLTRLLDSPAGVPPLSIVALRTRAEAYTALGETEKAAADTAKAEELQKNAGSP